MPKTPSTCSVPVYPELYALVGDTVPNLAGATLKSTGKGDVGKVYTNVSEGGYFTMSASSSSANYGGSSSSGASTNYVGSDDSIFHGCIKSDANLKCLEYGDVRILSYGNSVSEKVWNKNYQTYITYTWANKGGGMVSKGSYYQIRDSSVAGQDIIGGQPARITRTGSTSYIPLGGVTSYMSTRYLIRAKP